jgi:hypothetical protein
VHSTVIDYALRRIAPEHLSTPEVTDARDPQLLGSAGSLLLLYSDARGKASLIFGRTLELDGKPRGEPSLISASEEEYNYDPGMARAADGSHWVVFTQATSRKVHDLHLRHVDQHLSPVAPSARVTAYAPPKKRRVVASSASIALGGDLINVAYRVQRGLGHQVMQLRISPRSAQLSGGGVAAASESPVESGDEESDRFAGQAVTLSERAGVQAQPRIACLDAGCFTVWSDEANGAQAALVSKDTGEVLWRRNFSAKGARPALAGRGGRGLVAWYEADQVRVATLDKNGVGEPSVVASVKGLQPYPEVVAGAEPAQWYISWRSYEAAVFEPFVARVDCE